jgi:enoyl-CoA hydratase
MTLTETTKKRRVCQKRRYLVTDETLEVQPQLKSSSFSTLLAECLKEAFVTVKTETVGRVRVVEIARPEVRNAGLLHTSFVDFEADDTVEVAVLTGAGGTFCAGADLRALAAETGERVNVDGRGPMGPTRLRLSKPVIAAVEGHAVGGGLELAIWCDLRVAGEDAIFGVFNRRFGVPLVDGGTVRLPRLIGQSHALDMILTGRGVAAPEATMMGLVNRMVSTGDAKRTAIQLAGEIAAHPSVCMRNDRAATLTQWSLSEEAAMSQELELGLQTIASGEAASGARRFRDGHGRHGR